jgi:hypothetical protein
VTKGKLLIYEENVCERLEVVVERMFFSEPLIEADQKEVAKIVRLRDVGLLLIAVIQGKRGYAV